MFSKPISFSHLDSVQSLSICFLMAFLYVFSLYVWSHENRYNRNSASVMKRRFLSVTSTCLLSFTILSYFSKTVEKNGHSLLDWVGMRFDRTVFNAISLPLVLTAILFAGPLMQSYLMIERLAIITWLSNAYRCFDSRTDAHSRFKRNYINNAFWWRNYIISPFTEEFVFRACMLPLLVHNFGHAYSILITPLFFGLAHLHHIIESYMLRESGLTRIVLVHLFQFFYTYLFGLYSSYVYLRTSSVLACFVCHSFCNYMGFPDINEVFDRNEKLKSIFIMSCYLAGMFWFCRTIETLTEPTKFGNSIFPW
jgi:prenyl protein peptidase